MNVRRYVLRAAVAALCFFAGWGIAALLGVAAPAARLELVVPHVEVRDLAPPGPRATGCLQPKLRHAQEWEELRELEELELELPPPPERLAPPPPPVRPRR